VPQTLGDVWYCIPSCNPGRAREVTEAWREMGYHVAVLVDRNRLEDFLWGEDAPDFVLETRQYPGYYGAVNLLSTVLRHPHSVYLHNSKITGIKTHGSSTVPSIVVTGGDDIYPDANLTAFEIRDTLYARRPDGFFVAQPTGDVVAMPGTDKICGSPWFGRAWLERGYGGLGPFCADYFQFYGDEELQNVAKLTGAYVALPNVTQRHEHYHRPGGPTKTDYQARNETHYWSPDQKTFYERQKKGWPGHQPLAEITNERSTT
jgi:hypothetical protein